MPQMDDLLREWTKRSHYDKRLDRNAPLLEFLGEWVYYSYKPFPEKPVFWDRLYSWLKSITTTEYSINDGSLISGEQKLADMQSLFNLVPWVVYAGEDDIVSSYRAAYDAYVCKWLIDECSFSPIDPQIDAQLLEARRNTWFGSLAGMDINTFCRVNGIFGQTHRPEFRLLASVSDSDRIKAYLTHNKYARIVILEDVVCTGEQFSEVAPLLSGLDGFPILFIPLYISFDGYNNVTDLIQTMRLEHVTCCPLFVLPEACTIRKSETATECQEFAEFRTILRRYTRGGLGHGKEYGTLMLTYLNCPDGVPPFIHTTEGALTSPLFRRASREVD